jgi:hypothetical protein
MAESAPSVLRWARASRACPSLQNGARNSCFTRLEVRGQSRRSAILLSAVSFALIHEFLPDKLLVTFLLGIVE